jgi:hypothetical protein
MIEKPATMSSTPLNQQCGFHVKESPVNTTTEMRSHDVKQHEVKQSALSFGTPVLSSATAHPIGAVNTKLYRISGQAKARLAPASMSPGLAVSQGDMTLAEHSHLTPGVKKMMRSVVRGLKAYQEPEAASEGLGGTYFFKSETGNKIAIMKPCDEEPMAPSNPKGFTGRKLGEPGMKPTVRVGEAASREVAAYLLDHENYAGVPHTVMVRMAHPMFHYNDGLDGPHLSNMSQPQDDGSFNEEDLPLKLGSLQSFVRHECDTTEMGPKLFNKKDVQRIGILDIRLFNTDRHGGNILVQRVVGGRSDCSNLHSEVSFVSQQHQYKLVPIDHGFALPEGLEPPYFEWQHWPQAMMPFEKEELDYIAALDAKSDVETLQKELPDIHESSLRLLELSTQLLQQCAAAGLTLSEIAELVTRPMIGIDEEPSELEKLCFEIRREMFREACERESCTENTVSHLSSMTLDSVDDIQVLQPASYGNESSTTFIDVNTPFASLIGESGAGGAGDVPRKTTDDVLFSMDEDSGAKTPAPNSPHKENDSPYVKAPTLRVKATGEFEHVSTPFGTTFKSVLGGAAGSSPSYDSDSPTHQNDSIPEDEAISGFSEISTFRGAQSYIPTLGKFHNTVIKQAGRHVSKHSDANTFHTSSEEPRGCNDPCFVLKEMDEEDWRVFMSKAVEKIQERIASRVWVDSLSSHQMVQMSCPAHF